MKLFNPTESYSTSTTAVNQAIAQNAPLTAPTMPAGMIL